MPELPTAFHLLRMIKSGEDRRTKSDSLRATPESFVQPRANIVRQREELAVAIKLDGFARGVKHRVAMVALAEVSFECFFQFRVQLTIEIIRELIDRLPAVHQAHPRPKTLLNSSRSHRRARKSRAFTAPMVRSSNCAVSSAERPSTSRK